MMKYRTQYIKQFNICNYDFSTEAYIKWLEERLRNSEDPEYMDIGGMVCTACEYYSETAEYQECDTCIFNPIFQNNFDPKEQTK